jgi:hypothetical protein
LAFPLFVARYLVIPGGQHIVETDESSCLDRAPAGSEPGDVGRHLQQAIQSRSARALRKPIISPACAGAHAHHCVAAGAVNAE